MANQWFRLYYEFADDPKVQMMSEAMQRRLIMLLCSKCKGETLHETELAFHWRVTETDIAETKRVFIEKGFIDSKWNLLNWDKRQYISDSSTDRVRRHRQAKKQNETLPKHPPGVTVTPPDTDTDTDTEHIKDSLPVVTDRPEEFANTWNRSCGRMFPKVTKFTDSRRKKIKLRMAEGMTLPVFREVIGLCLASNFLTGSDGGWKANFDWVFENGSNWVKIHEGNYVNKPDGGTSKKQIEMEQKINDTVRNSEIAKERILGKGRGEVQSTGSLPGQVRTLLESPTDNSGTDRGMVRGDSAVHGQGYRTIDA